MSSPKHQETQSKDNAETRVGKGKVRMAHHGRDSLGLKMKPEDRAKLLRSGAKDLLAGMKKAQSTDSNQ
jgi:hypothetical protein